MNACSILNVSDTIQPPVIPSLTSAEQQAILNSLAILLGAPFEPAKPLEPVATSSVSMPPPPDLAPPRRISALRSRNSGASEKRGESSGTLAEEQPATEITWMDVGEVVVSAVDAAVKAGLEERVSHRTTRVVASSTI